MGTTCMINFCFGDRVAAKIYRQNDGYPGGIDRDLDKFFDDVEKQCPNDTRFNDPTYLAAKFVVWQAGEYLRSRDCPLDFLGIGVTTEDYATCVYHWFVDCNPPPGARPSVRCKELDCNKKEI